MTLPRDIILDLLPVYLAGDASEATRVLVEEHLRADPELAARVQRAATFQIDSKAEVPPDLEMRALRGARRRLAALRWAFGLACFFSAISLGVEINHENGSASGTLLLVRYPALMVYPVLIALACWAAYFLQRRRRPVV